MGVNKSQIHPPPRPHLKLTSQSEHLFTPKQPMKYCGYHKIKDFIGASTSPILYPVKPRENVVPGASLNWTLGEICEECLPFY